MGDRMPEWVRQGFDEYARRTTGECRLILKEIALEKRTKHIDLRRLVRNEGERMLNVIPRGSHVVVSDVDGNPWGSEEVADALSR